MVVRPASVVVQAPQVCESLKPWLDKRFPGFRWDGLDYGRPSRTQAADRDGLLRYAGPLEAILKLATSGFPTLCSLRDAFILCDEKYKIFNDEKGIGRHAFATKVADVWRKMCGDVYQMAKSGVYEDELVPLVGCVVVKKLSPTSASEPSEPTSTSPRAVEGTGMPTFADFDDLDDNLEQADESTIDVIESEGEAEIVQISCTCPDCRLPVPSAKQGGQKQKTYSVPEQSVPKRRLRQKTTFGPTKPVPIRRKPLTKQHAPRMKLKAADQAIVLPIEVVKRAPSEKRVGESYILHNVRKRSYIVGCTSRGHRDYLDIIQHVAKLIEKKNITMASEAKGFVEKLISGKVKWTA